MTIMMALDMETMKALAEVSAKTAAQEISKEVREEMKSQFEEQDRRLEEKLKAHFGTMEPSKHIVQHDRMERFLALVDRFGENLIGRILTSIVVGLLVVGLVGYAIWTKFTGGAL